MFYPCWLLQNLLKDFSRKCLYQPEPLDDEPVIHLFNIDNKMIESKYKVADEACTRFSQRLLVLLE